MIGLSLKLGWFKSRPYPSHFIFDIIVGKRRIRHTTTLQLIDEFPNRFKIDWRFKFRVVICRIHFFLTLISKIKWLGSGLPLKFWVFPMILMMTHLQMFARIWLIMWTVIVAKPYQRVSICKLEKIWFFKTDFRMFYFFDGWNCLSDNLFMLIPFEYSVQWYTYQTKTYSIWNSRCCLIGVIMQFRRVHCSNASPL